MISDLFPHCIYYVASVEALVGTYLTYFTTWMYYWYEKYLDLFLSGECLGLTTILNKKKDTISE